MILHDWTGVTEVVRADSPFGALEIPPGFALFDAKAISANDAFAVAD